MPPFLTPPPSSRALVPGSKSCCLPQSLPLSWIHIDDRLTLWTFLQWLLHSTLANHLPWVSSLPRSAAHPSSLIQAPYLWRYPPFLASCFFIFSTLRSQSHQDLPLSHTFPLNPLLSSPSIWFPGITYPMPFKLTEYLFIIPTRQNPTHLLSLREPDNRADCLINESWPTHGGSREWELEIKGSNGHSSRATMIIRHQQKQYRKSSLHLSPKKAT